MILPFCAERRRETRSRGLPPSDYRRRWLSPGVAIASSLAAGISGFSSLPALLQFIQSTYGSLGALIILMLWFLSHRRSILLGGEINASLKKRLEISAVC